MRYAEVRDGVVTNIIELIRTGGGGGGNGQFINFILAESDTHIGDTYDASTGFTRRVKDPLDGLPLDAAKTKMKRLVTEQFRGCRDGGVTVDGRVIATTNDGRQEIAAAVVETASGTTQKAVTRAGAAVVFTNTQFAAALAAIDKHRKECLNREYDLYAAIDAANSKAGLRAIDIYAGWP